ncbi:ABC transporter substrate-binding protein [Ornithinibacillus sp. 4-3]|uniref:ABC transporter substrate-binding protein n=1 Tax=Ornithinibacillus sp. 4-3 TaxID=3231488 RepID=A0AB39HP55_9BACI
MGLNKKNIFLNLLIATVIFLVACSSDSSESNNNSGSSNKGPLKVAVDAPPSTLDIPVTTSTHAQDIGRLIFEGLVTIDSDFQPVPMLAESIETDDNKTYIFNLRQGIKFHNGKEMIAEDVVASMERWMEKSSITGTIFNDATWSAVDDHTVLLELKEASLLVLDTLSSLKQAAAIMPKEIVESAPAEGIEEYIGTGPYQLEEWKQDQYIHLKKYEDYQSLDMEASGFSGKREALIEEIYFYMVPDPSTRLSGLQTGEYDYAYGIQFDDYEQLQNDPDMETLLVPTSNNLLGFNKVEGIASNFEFRQIINTALDADAIMLAGYPHEDFYWLDPGYMDVNVKTWASDARSEYYNQNDPEKAKQMLEDIGYNGEEFRILATRDIFPMYNQGVVIQEQLKQIGINATLEVYDWAGFIKKRDDLSAWDAFVSDSGTVSTPTQLNALSSTWAGGVNDDKVGETLRAIEVSPTIEEAKALWDELQLYAYEELLPIVHLGGNNMIYAYHKKLENVKATSRPIFWNITISE